MSKTMPADHRCPSCGAVYPPTELVCPQCRTILTPATSRKKTPPAVIALLILVIAALFIYAVYLAWQELVLHRF